MCVCCEGEGIFSGVSSLIPARIGRGAASVSEGCLCEGVVAMGYEEE